MVRALQLLLFSKCLILILFFYLGNGSHASVAAIFSNLNDQETSDYLKDLDNMTKVVLKAESEEQIMNAAKTLEENNVKHYIWREQPENLISALASKPIYFNLQNY